MSRGIEKIENVKIPGVSQKRTGISRLLRSRKSNAEYLWLGLLNPPCLDFF